MLTHAVDILEEPDMTQLVHLVMANGLILQLSLDVLKIVQRSCK